MKKHVVNKLDIIKIYINPLFHKVVQTAEVTALRGGKFMHTEDIKFLMRKDKVSFLQFGNRD